MKCYPFPTSLTNFKSIGCGIRKLLNIPLSYQIKNKVRHYVHFGNLLNDGSDAIGDFPRDFHGISSCACVDDVGFPQRWHFSFVESGHNIAILGQGGTGKTWLAKRLINSLSSKVFKSIQKFYSRSSELHLQCTPLQIWPALVRILRFDFIPI